MSRSIIYLSALSRGEQFNHVDSTEFEYIKTNQLISSNKTSQNFLCCTTEQAINQISPSQGCPVTGSKVSYDWPKCTEILSEKVTD